MRATVPARIGVRAMRRLRAFAAARSGIAAVEAAMIMPVLFLFMLGGTELARYIDTARQLTNLANSMATLVAERTTGFNFLDAVFTYNSAMVTFPQVLKDSNQKGIAWNLDIAITVSSILFTPTVPGCSTGCTYKAKVAWSINMPIAQARSCTTAPVSVADTAPPSITTLPQDVYNAGSLIVADVVYTYVPRFASRFIPSLTIRRSVYMQPRYMTTIPYTVIVGDPYAPCS